MAFWLELMCDMRMPDDKKKVRIAPACHSDAAANPGIQCKDPRSGATILRELALEKGWVSIPSAGWACPYCKTQDLAFKRKKK